MYYFHNLYYEILNSIRNGSKEADNRTVLSCVEISIGTYSVSTENTTNLHENMLIKFVDFVNFDEIDSKFIVTKVDEAGTSFEFEYKEGIPITLTGDEKWFVNIGGDYNDDGEGFVGNLLDVQSQIRRLNNKDYTPFAWLRLTEQRNYHRGLERFVYAYTIDNIDIFFHNIAKEISTQTRLKHNIDKIIEIYAKTFISILESRTDIVYNFFGKDKFEYSITQLPLPDSSGTNKHLFDIKTDAVFLNIKNLKINLDSNECKEIQ